LLLKPEFNGGNANITVDGGNLQHSENCCLPKIKDDRIIKIGKHKKNM
jgi:hypothetical protein